MATIRDELTGAEREVKNLGWLLRHTGRVIRLEVEVSPRSDRDARLSAVLEGAERYVTDFADREVLRRWLDRPVFRGKVCVWFGEPRVVGCPRWSAGIVE